MKHTQEHPGNRTVFVVSTGKKIEKKYIVVIFFIDQC